MTPTAGRLLVASPLIGDTNFDRSVIFMLEHNDEGALGVVLNKPTTTTVDDMLPAWAPLAARPSLFFLGGPVSPESVIGLGQRAEDDPDDSFVTLVADVGAVDLNRSPMETPFDFTQVRLFAGYSGWGPHQLESELAVDAWFVVDADPDDIFSDDPDDLWSNVLARQSGPLAWLANYPLDPSLN